MKNPRIYLTMIMFCAAVVVSLASKRVVSSHTKGVVNGACNTEVSFDGGGTCYTDGMGANCTISSANAFKSQTNCETQLKRLN